MAVPHHHKCHQCRREGQKLFLKGERCLSAKCAIVRRNYPPGVHGPKGKSRLSNYGMQLREKQKAKRSYGILERQFRGYYERAKKQHGKTGELMLQRLECRLDNVLYRGGFATSRLQGRQLVGHAQVEVNGRSVNIPSLLIHDGDVIRVKKSKASHTYWEQVKKQKPLIDVPGWVTVDRENLVITVTQLPAVDQITTDLQMNLIIEYYSR